MATKHFRNGSVYLAPGSGAAVNIVEGKGFKLTINADLASDNAFGDTWKSNLKGLMGWSGSFDCNFDTAQVTLFNALTTATSAQPIYLYPDRSVTANYYYGSCWPESMDVSGDITSVGTASLNFTGDGALSVN